MPRTYKPKTTRKNGRHKPQQVPARYEPGFIASMDGRTELCRLLRERFDSIAGDLGGADELSTIKSSLLERFIWLESALSRLEQAMATATDAKTTSEIMCRWIQACNSLLGIAKTLGIERQMKTVDLKAYVAGNGQTGSAVE